jgi:chromosomal replication initiator protein
MLRHMSLSRFVPFPENQSALTAIQDLVATLRTGKLQGSPSPVFLHGPPGSGKTHLASALVTECAAGTGLVIHYCTASDFREPAPAHVDKQKLATNEAAHISFTLIDEAKQCDLLVVDDIQHLPLPAAETLVQIIDYRQAHQLPMVFTANTGPRHLAHRGVRYLARLTSRLAAGLVVGLEPLKIASRQRFLDELAQRTQLALPRDIMHWLARHLTGGGRQLEGTLTQLATLNKLSRRPLDLKSVMAHFGAQVDAIRPSVERISTRVSDYFHLEPRQMQSRRRHHNVVLPRQISMYLARQLTELSLIQIGTYFGGRDHTTVLHACRKVEQAMKKDAVLSGAVRQIHAELA